MKAQSDAEQASHPERRPVYRHTSHTIDGKHSVNDPSIWASALANGTGKLILLLLIVGSLLLFFRHWYTTTDISHESISSLQKMPCSKFSALSPGDQRIVATRLFVASGGANESVVNNEMGSANMLLNTQSSCQSNPSGTVMW